MTGAAREQSHPPAACEVERLAERAARVGAAVGPPQGGAEVHERTGPLEPRGRAGEHRVATLAAEGRSNREIAERLFVTQRTVETHLTHAFQKLDVRTRAALPALLEAAARPEPAHLVHG